MTVSTQQNGQAVTNRAAPLRSTNGGRRGFSTSPAKDRCRGRREPPHQRTLPAASEPIDSALLLPGGKGVGKSTLTAALLRSGAGYLTDDVVFLDDRRRAAPLPVRLSVKEGSWAIAESLFPTLKTAPVYRFGTTALKYLNLEGPGSAPVALPARALVFPRYCPSEASALRRLTPQDALVRLVGERAWLSFEPSLVTSWTQWLTATPCYALEYASLDRAVFEIGKVARQKP